MNNDDDLESLAKRFLTLPQIDMSQSPLETLQILQQQSYEMKRLYDDMLALKIELKALIERGNAMANN